MQNKQLAEEIHKTDLKFLEFVEHAKELVCYDDKSNDPKLARFQEELKELLDRYDFIDED